MWKATDDSAQQAKGNQCNIAIHNHLGQDLPKESGKTSEDAATVRNKRSSKQQCSYTSLLGGMPLAQVVVVELLGWRAHFKSPSHSTNHWHQVKQCFPKTRGSEIQ